MQPTRVRNPLARRTEGGSSQAFPHQTAEMLDPDEDGKLWRLPIQPIYNRKHGVRKPLSGQSVTGPQMKRYFSYCTQIATSWRSTSPKDWLPADLHKSTPYSFALLSHLTKLALLTIDRRSHAHELLSQASFERQASRLSLNDHGQAREDRAWIPKEWLHRRAEREAVEMPNGLCIEDVNAAITRADAELVVQREAILSTMSADAAEKRFGKFLENLDRAAAKQLQMMLSGRKAKGSVAKAGVGAGKVQKSKESKKRVSKGMKARMTKHSAQGKKAKSNANDGMGVVKREENGEAEMDGLTLGPAFQLPTRGL